MPGHSGLQMKSSTKFSCPYCLWLLVCIFWHVVACLMMAAEECEKIKDMACFNKEPTVSKRLLEKTKSRYINTSLNTERNPESPEYNEWLIVMERLAFRLHERISAQSFKKNWNNITDIHFELKIRSFFVENHLWIFQHIQDLHSIK